MPSYHGSGYPEIAEKLISVMQSKDLCIQSNNGAVALDWLKGKIRPELCDVLSAKMAERDDDCYAGECAAQEYTTDIVVAGESSNYDSDTLNIE